MAFPVFYEFLAPSMESVRSWPTVGTVGAQGVHGWGGWKPGFHPHYGDWDLPENLCQLAGESSACFPSAFLQLALRV